VAAMAVSFPGMNPYLEHPDRWSTVHNRLIVAIADLLTPQLLPKYQVDIEKRIYEVIDGNLLFLGRSDVSVQEPRQAQSDPTNRIATVPTTQPVRVTVPMTEEMREAYLEVREVATQRVVTTLEILSPANKKGQGRQKYEEKRQRVFESRSHLVEIDLLRDGTPLPVLGTTLQSDYRILISRSDQRPAADLYLFNVQDPIPVFSLPLQPEDSEPIVNLKELPDQVYERSGYDYFIDYNSAPVPELSPEQRSWLDKVLRS
jgi:hypothetical protein